MGTVGWLSAAVKEFGIETKRKLAGAGDREAAIRAPLEQLLKRAGEHLDVNAVYHDEYRDSERRVRPDYGVSVNGTITGYVEVKAPGGKVDPSRFRGHDLRQWERQKDLPNLIYTNGTKWLLYRGAELVGEPVEFTGGSLEVAGAGLEAPPEFEALITDFLKWKPAPITSVRALVKAVAPLTRLLRGEVLDQLQDERKRITIGHDEWSQPFHGLASDWRALLFPNADDDTFADGYAQSVVFALLLARTEGINITDRSLHEVGTDLGSEHSLMGRALQLLTDNIEADFRVTLDLLVRIVGAVEWERIRSGKWDAYLHLYEHFLQEYDPELRKRSGSYYTPREVVHEMVRLTEDVLASRLDRSRGFRDPSVQTIDPAMGTGTYLHTILERVAEQSAAEDGPGVVPEVLSDAVTRLIGFEIQMGPYAVAELRASDLLAQWGARTPESGLNLFVADTLDNPYAAQNQIASGMNSIAQSRRRANEVKADANIQVVIGNPPYKDQAKGMGSWVEDGDSNVPKKKRRALMDDFKLKGNGVHERHLKSMSTYFYRWAAWKVFESVVDQFDKADAGVICYITTAGYLRGKGFQGMRKYLRETVTEGWIIDLTPEGHTPDVSTRVFPGVRQPLAIGIFYRRPGESKSTPAKIHYRSVSGRRESKFEQLRSISVDDAGWRVARSKWTAPFTPSGTTGWDDSPALDDLYPWTAGGIKASRTWIYSPSKDILEERWRRLVSETDIDQKRKLFKESPGVDLESKHEALPGRDVSTRTGKFRDERGEVPDPVRVAYRAFDRQWMIPDARLIQRPGQLWDGRVPGQLFMIEQHSEPVNHGAGVIFTTDIPELDMFKGRGGRALPLLHPDGSPNVTPGLLEALSSALGEDIEARDLIAYVAGVVSHGGFTARYGGELETPGVRVPLTRDPQLFREAAGIGAEVIWTQTYGEAFASAARPSGNIRYPQGDERQPLNTVAVRELPDTYSYDEERSALIVGTGEFAPVRPEVWDYYLARYGSGGRNVLKSWLNYRKAEPEGTRSSPLDHISASTWSHSWTRELIDLLTLLTRLTELEPAQKELLDRIVSSDLIDMDYLEDAGVSFPQNDTDRAPRKSYEALGGADEGELDFTGI